MERILSIIAKACLILIAMTACEKQQKIASLGSRSVNITIEDIAVTKAAQHKPKAETIKTFDLSDSLVLTVKVSDMPEAKKPVTKGTNVNTSTFFELYGENGFNVYAEKHGDPSTVLFDNDLFKYDGIVWCPEADIPWPEYATDYYAWAPSDIASLTASSKSFSYTVPQNNEDQIDLLVASAQADEGFEGSLHMTFYHALSEVKFTVNENIPAGSFYSLSLYQLKMNGSYDFTTGEWTIPGDAQKGSVTLDLSSSPVSIFENASEGDAITSDSQTFFVLPQTLSAYSSGIELQFKGPDDLEPKTYYLDFKDGFEFESNKCYTFAIGQTPREFYLGTHPTYNSGITLTNDVENSEEYRVPIASYKYNPEEWIDPDDPNYDMDKILNHDLFPDWLTDEIYGLSTIPWRIKSYVINGVQKEYSEEALINDGGIDAKMVESEYDDEVIENHYSLSVTGLAREQVENHLADNSTWTGSFGKWSPEDWSDKGVIDLSRMDVKKDTYNESVNAFDMTTANCYIVRHAGHYKFPLVYGNAMNKGVVNEGAYNQAKAEGIQEHFSYKNTISKLKTLENHIGNEISSPFIEQNENVILASGSSAYDVLWQDQAQIITIDKIEQEEVEITDTDGSKKTVPVSYLYFTIPQNLICQNNALLCVKDTEGRIVWSWHIWTTNNPTLLDDATMVLSSTPDNRSQSFYFHPMNSIGWIDPSITCPGRNDVELVLEQEGSGKELRVQIKQPETRVSSSGTVMYYQWGRKDPFPSKGFVSLGEEPLAQGSMASDNFGGEHPVSESILSPTCFFSGSTDDSYESYWFTPHYCNLWGAYETPFIYNESDWYLYFSDFNIKTVYDPSPIGYKVPIPPAFSALKRDNYMNDYVPLFGGGNKGINFWTYYQDLKNISGNYPSIYFAASGFRSANRNGELDEQDNVIAYWKCYIEDNYDHWSSYFLSFDYEKMIQDEKYCIDTYKPSYSFMYSVISELSSFLNGRNSLTNGLPVRPVSYERFENEPHIGNKTVIPYEEENYTIEW